MANLGNFNATDVDPNFSFEPVPQGKYLAVITDSEMKETKNRDGRYLELTFQIIEGDHRERMLWSRLNLENANATAVKIARAELSAICRSVGVLAPKDSVELHNVPLVITVGHKKRDDNGELTNVIKGYERKGAASAAAPRPAAAATAGNGKAPWQR
ncbi:MAG: DUF669 domain-containing protein [Planctomycetia bacterium]|nr:MAG: DUF669 domain-containing protein [Planctomycetia bacterium]